MRLWNTPSIRRRATLAKEPGFAHFPSFEVVFKHTTGLQVWLRVEGLKAPLLKLEGLERKVDPGCGHPEVATHYHGGREVPQREYIGYRV